MTANPNEAQFFQAVLGYIGAPQTPLNVAVLEKWSVGEKPAGYWSQWWNPINTTQGEPGAVSVNSVGVKSFASAQAGELATAQTLQSGYYPALLGAFRKGGPLSTFQTSAVVSEVERTWGTKSFGRLIGSSAVVSQGAPAQAVQAGNVVATPSAGPDLNPLDWLGSAFGVAGQAAGSVAGGVAGGFVTGTADALGGVFRGLLTTAGGSMVALATALVITLILISPRGAQKAVETVTVNNPAPAPAPAASDDDELLSAEEEAEYQKAYHEWQLDQGQQVAQNRAAGRQVMARTRASRGRRSAQVAAAAMAD